MSDIYIAPGNGVADVALNVTGHPRMTGGLGNAVYLSVFMAAWWGNRVSPAGERYTSTVPAKVGDMLTNRTARDVVAAIKAALAWMTAQGVAAAVDVTAEINTRDRLDVRIIVTEPDQSRTSYAYGLNWAAQSVEVLA